MRPDHDTILAPATAAGGALAVIRISGEDAFVVCDRIFRGRTPLAAARGYTVHYGRIVDGDRTVDDVLAAVFRAPHSYTGENSVELSCHGSSYIVSEILRLLLAAGGRMAAPGEFTLRAYFAGKLDLSQAEAVADLIASSSRAAHALASDQMRGGYSAALDALRERLLHLASMLELELDFSEEDVEFADRSELRRTMERIDGEIERLRNSFALGNALKEGIPVAIVGAPNAGKSTLLNRLLNEERAIVSDIAGTTRDIIEEAVNIEGIRFRFVDTAGIRTTDDRLERMGIERTLQRIAQARIIIRVLDSRTIADASRREPFDTTDPNHPERSSIVRTTAPAAHFTPAIPAPDFEIPQEAILLTVINKIDLHPEFDLPQNVIGLSAQNGQGLDSLRHALLQAVENETFEPADIIVSNGRHFEALTAAHEALLLALQGLADRLPADLLSEDIRQVIRHIGEITGRGVILSDEILDNIFSKFCIGK